MPIAIASDGPLKYAVRGGNLTIIRENFQLEEPTRLLEPHLCRGAATCIIIYKMKIL